MKTLYAMMFAAMMTCQAQAQTARMFEGTAFSKFSPDGTWLVENNNGSLNILNAKTGDEYSSADPTGNAMYMVGLGNSVTNSGVLAGTCGDYAGIWQNGSWTTLPQATGVGTTYNAANAITPDERRIVGILGNDGTSFGSDGMQAYPVVWTKNDMGEYECAKLPCPEKDFLGLVPQYITATSISEDGKTIVGQVRDNSGFYVLPIVYRESADGEWSYTILGEEDVYDKTRLNELPKVPEQPKYPNVGDYMTQEDVDAYEAAYAKYEEQLNLYYQGIIDEYPDYPMYEDYIGDQERKDAYVAALKKYQEDQQAYMDAYTAYQNKLAEITTKCDFVQNALYVSGNGRYVGATLEDRATGDSWSGSNVNYIGYFDLQAAEPSFVRCTAGGDYLLTSVLNDATMFVGTPAKEYTRNTFVVRHGESSNQMLTLPQYVSERSEEMSKWIVDNNSYDVTIWGYDDNWEPYEKDVITDSLVTGTVMTNSDGTLIVSYYTDQFSSNQQARTLSYVVDLNTTTGIGTAVADRQKKTFGATLSGHSIVAGADTDKMEVYDMEGRKLNADANQKTVTVGSGVYVVRTTGKNGQNDSRKVVVE